MSLFAKVDAHLDANPKIAEAGFWGSVVFQYVLRVNARTGRTGNVALRYCRNAFVARNVTLDECVTDLNASPEALIERGFRACSDVDLLRQEEDGSWSIVGWDTQWKGAETNAARQRRYRQRKREQEDGVTPSNGSNAALRLLHIKSKSKSKESDARAPTHAPAHVASPDPVPDQELKTKVHRLWQLQAELRSGLMADGIAGNGLTVTPTPAVLSPIRERLSESSFEECEHVLRVYAAEAKGSGSLQYFNGSTNWRFDGFRRALGTKPQPTKPQPSASNPYAGVKMFGAGE